LFEVQKTAQAATALKNKEIADKAAVVAKPAEAIPKEESKSAVKPTTPIVEASSVK